MPNLRKRGREDRSLTYTDWRRTIGEGTYCQDIDQVEYRIIDDEIVPVLMLELTRYDYDTEPTEGYFAAILERFGKSQRKSATSFATLLGGDCIIVLFKHDLAKFWIFNLTTNQGWYSLDKKGYEDWLVKCRGRN